MNVFKQLVGIVVGVFCTLIFAGLASYCCNIDLKWYISLSKPVFTPTGGMFTMFLSVTYISTIWVISRLFVHKNFLPALPLLAALGISCILYLYLFFGLKQIYASMFFMSVTSALSLGLLIIFIAKDWKCALIYLPSFFFNAFCFVLMAAICFSN